MRAILEKLHLTGEQPGAGSGTWLECAGLSQPVVTPVTGVEIGRIRCATRDEYEKVARRAVEAFAVWRETPAPRRGEIVRQIGQVLRERKADLGALVSLETGKIREEGAGEIQEMIDIADFAVGQSRMLYGLSLHSERPRHRMFEQWHPLGPVGVVTAFNFPAAVWAWNAMLALAAGDTVIWKPSSKAALTAVAVMRTVWPVLAAQQAPAVQHCNESLPAEEEVT
jgi:aldehyde dehydrogenase (NAD+)